MREIFQDVVDELQQVLAAPEELFDRVQVKCGQWIDLGLAATWW